MAHTLQNHQATGLFGPLTTGTKDYTITVKSTCNTDRRRDTMTSDSLNLAGIAIGGRSGLPTFATMYKGKGLGEEVECTLHNE